MKVLIDLDEELLRAARRTLGTANEADTIHAALRLVMERADRRAATRELLSIDRDWTGILDVDKSAHP